MFKLFRKFLRVISPYHFNELSDMLKFREMGKKKYIFLLLALILIVFACFFVYNSKGEVLGISEEIEFVSPEASESFNPPTPTPTITPSPTPISTSAPTKIPSPTVAPTKVPTPTPSPKIISATSEEINGFIDRFSSQYGVDPNIIRHLALCESGFNSGVTNGIYAGLFQFNSVTWKNIRAEMGEDSDPNLRFSAEESAQTAAYSVSKGKSGMWPNCFPK